MRVRQKPKAGDVENITNLMEVRSVLG